MQTPFPFPGPTFAAVITAMAAALLPSSAVVAAAPGSLNGVVTANAGQVALPGVEVALVDTAGAELRRVSTDAAGRFAFEALAPGRYVVVATAPGFVESRAGPIALESGASRDLRLDLVLAPVREAVEVRGAAGTAGAHASAPEPVAGRLVDVLPVASDSYRALLPVLPGVVRQADGRISLKGSKPTQGALAVGGGSGVDPSSGGFALELPSDAIESMEVDPSPYAAEDGRFSAGVVRIETRAGGPRWRATANSFIPAPCFTICDGHTVGVQNYNPRVWFGGPVVGQRVFVSQAIEYRLAHARIPSLPDPQNKQRSDSVDAFTRIDVRAGVGHAVTASVAIFPRRLQNAGLNTFTPADVAPTVRTGGYQIAGTDAVTLSPRFVVTSSLTASVYDVRVSPDEPGEMVFSVDGIRGTYFNRQRRMTRAWQWTESATVARSGPYGEHLLKAGLDILRASYDGESESSAVIVRRADGSVSWRQDAGDAAQQHAAGTDVAAYAQDRWRPHPRLVVEGGFRVDHDGVLGSTTFSPRLGGLYDLVPTRGISVKAGVGVFRERTPLNVGAFTSMESPEVTTFAPDGITPTGPPVAWRHTTGRLTPPRSLTWNVEYDEQLGGQVYFKVNHLQRRGSHEFIVEPIDRGGEKELRLSAGGRSAYRETEVTIRFGADDDRQATISYVRSRSVGDLNAFDQYFGTLRVPIVPQNHYATTSVDVPNRLLARASVPVWRRWIASSLFELRDGFPYSIVDENQAYVGRRNAAGRLPPLSTLDVSLLRSGHLLGREVRFGIRVFHVLNTFEPRDIQTNRDAAAFGSMYNSLLRRIMFTTQLTGR